MIQKLSYEALVELAQQTECEDEYHKFCSELFRRCQDWVRNLALSYIRNLADADDVVQEVCVKIWQKLPNFRRESSFNTWVHRITVNTVVDFQRRNLIYETIVSSASVQSLGSHHTDTLQLAVARERIEMLRAAIDELAGVDSLLIKGKAFDDLSYEELSKKHKIPKGTVATKLRRARIRLREKLTKELIL